jgi:hypothetical protein
MTQKTRLIGRLKERQLWGMLLQPIEMFNSPISSTSRIYEYEAECCGRGTKTTAGDNCHLHRQQSVAGSKIVNEVTVTKVILFIELLLRYRFG